MTRSSDATDAPARRQYHHAPARRDGAQHAALRPRRGASLSARARARGAGRARPRRHPSLRPGEHPLRHRCVQHADLVRPQRVALPLCAGGGPGPPVRVQRLQRSARRRAPHPRRGPPRHLLPLLHRRPATDGEGEGVGRRPGLGDPRAQRRQHAHRHRPCRAAGRHRDAAARLRDRRRLRGDGERTQHQVRRRDRAHAPQYRCLRGGHRDDAGGARARHHRKRALGRAPPREHRRRRRVDRDPPPRVRAAHQSLVPRIVAARHRARRHRRLRHRPRGPLRLLLRHLAHLGVRCAAQRRAAAPLRRGLMRTSRRTRHC